MKRPFASTIADPSDLVVFLDLDMTLIYASTVDHAVSYGHPEDTFLVNLPLMPTVFDQGEEPSVEVRILSLAVRKRPFVDKFLAEVSARYAEVHVFTASQQNYADQVLDKLDPNGTIFTKRWYRDSCTCLRKGDYSSSANLRKDILGLDWKVKGERSIDPKRFVLVDDCQDVMMKHASNGILISEFCTDNDGDDEKKKDPKDDTALLQVLKLLQKLDTAADVRPVLKKKFDWGVIEKKWQFDMHIGATPI